jgi:DnaK suppressor protein
MASSPRASRKAPASGSKKTAARPASSRPAKAPARKPSAAKASRPAKAAPARATAARKAAAAPASRPAKPAKAARPTAKPAAKAPASRPAPAKAAATKAPPAKAATKDTTPSRKAPPPASRPAAPAPAARRPTRPGAPEPNGSSSTLIHGIPPYQPTPGEIYMNERQLEHFRQILLAWKRELMEEVDRTVHHMQDEASNFPDPNDRATQESEFGLELRTRDRERKLLKKIDSALERIDDGSYGYCEETGEEIGLKRLEARPVATLSLEAQERRELAERQYGERDDRFR